jgi:predicted nucleotidyltransferase
MLESRVRNLDLPEEEISGFCQRWRITEFALFGSVLCDDFDADSDLDILVTFGPDADWSLLDHVQMEQELEALLGLSVDLLTRRAVERSHNWLRRREILDTAEVVYAAR